MIAKQFLTLMGAAFLLGACAQSPADIAPAYTSELQFKDWSCEQLAEEQGRLVMALTTASAQQQEAHSNDIAGVILLGLPVASLSGSNIASQVARLKGERDAIERALTMNDCAAAVKAEAPVSVAATREGDEDLRNVTSVVPAMSEQWVASGVEADIHVGKLGALDQFIPDPADGVVILREEDAPEVQPTA